MAASEATGMRARTEGRAATKMTSHRPWIMVAARVRPPAWMLTELRMITDVTGNAPIRPAVSGEDALVPHMRTLTEGTDLTTRDFFPLVYDLLLGRPKGPKLTTLVTTMGGARALALLEPSLAAAAS